MVKIFAFLELKQNLAFFKGLSLSTIKKVSSLFGKEGWNRIEDIGKKAFEEFFTPWRKPKKKREKILLKNFGLLFQEKFRRLLTCQNHEC